MYKKITPIGRKIRKLREEKNITQDELAKKIGLKNHSLINNIETGRTQKPQIKTLEKIAEILEVSFEYLMDNEREIKPRMSLKEGLAARERKVAYDIEIAACLRELLEDKVSMNMMGITEEEIEWMKSIRFRGKYPTKETYINMLFEYRKLDEGKG